jgi:hypothetical protein
LLVYKHDRSFHGLEAVLQFWNVLWMYKYLAASLR